MQNETTFYSKKYQNEYKTIKISLDKLAIGYRKYKSKKKKKKEKDKHIEISRNNVNATIFDAVCRTNMITIHVYQFLRLWILDKYHKNQHIPEITEDIIKMVYKTLIKKTVGPSVKGENLTYLNEFSNFYKNEYMDLMDIKYKNINKNDPEVINSTKFNGEYLSQVISYMATDILKNIINNIQMHFYKYIKRFVFGSFKKHNKKLRKYDIIIMTYSRIVKRNKELQSATIDKNMKCTIENIIKIYGNKVKVMNEARKKFLKKINSELYLVFQDIINQTTTCEPKYHQWLNENRKKILPGTFKVSLNEDLNIEPQKFLKYMIFMNGELEKMEVKQFQFSPLRTSLIPKYIMIDTKTLVELFISEEKQEYLNNLNKYQHDIWSKFFNMNQSVFRCKNYTFNYSIMTDGYVASVLMIRNDYLEKETINKQKKKNGKKEIKKACEGMNEEQKKIYKDNRKEKQKGEAKKLKLEKAKGRNTEREKNKKYMEDFEKNLGKISTLLKKQKIKEEKEKLKKGKRKDKKETYVEFPYINEHLSDIEIEHLKKAYKVYCDPGKKKLYQFLGDDGTYFCYTNKQRLKETKRIKQQKYIERYKVRLQITEIERKLSTVNSKSCDYTKFKEYIKLKNEISIQLYDLYKKEKFRRLNWYSHINRQRSEANLLHTIKEKYGEDAIIIMGDWKSSEQLKGNISTPNIGLKRKVREKFMVYNFDEFRTSCLNSETEERCNNLYAPDKDGIKRKIHSVLTYKMENKRYGNVNRDKNAVNNIKKIVTSYLENKKRPERYKRGVNIDNTE